MTEWLKKVKSVNLLFLLKTGVGSALAIIIAESLGLAYSPSAGIITLLTIQNTKKETLSIALKRMEAFLLAGVISYILFSSLGYTAIAFGGFVILFVAFCNLLDLKDGISMNAVLMTHFLIEKNMELGLIFNEVSLLLIGMGIGIILNLLMPRYREQIRRDQRNLEEEMRRSVHGLAGLLKSKNSCLMQESQHNVIDAQNRVDTQNDVENQNRVDAQNDVENQNRVDAQNDIEKQNRVGTVPLYDCIKDDLKEERLRAESQEEADADFSKLDSLLESTLRRAYEDAGNTLLTNTEYLVSYLEMRKQQLQVLKDIKLNIEKIPVLLSQSFPLADYMHHIADSFHELNNAKSLLDELEELNGYYRKEKLPQTRDEFEYRAVLFQILKELEYFLLIKRNFVQSLEEKNMKSYWEEKE